MEPLQSLTWKKPRSSYEWILCASPSFLPVIIFCWKSFLLTIVVHLEVLCPIATHNCQLWQIQMKKVSSPGCNFTSYCLTSEVDMQRSDVLSNMIWYRDPWDCSQEYVVACCLHTSSPCSYRQNWVISALSFASIFNNEPDYSSTRRYNVWSWFSPWLLVH